jgi:predicted methyltransferase MtxX (methanogen marker protein 4)
MAVALESIMATDSPIFDEARTQMAKALDQLLEAGAAAGAIRGDVSGRTVLRALGGICGMRATEGWQDEAVRITVILFDGLRFGAGKAG